MNGRMRRVPLVLLWPMVVALIFNAQMGAGAEARAEPRSGTAASIALPRLLLRSPAWQAGRAAPPGPFAFTPTTSDDGQITVYTYGASADFPRQFIVLAQNDLQHPVHDTLDLTLRRPVHIYVYRSRADFLAGAPVNNAAETGALTDARTDTVYLVSTATGDEGAINDLPHELTHVVFHQNAVSGHLEDAYFDLFPLWLDEGLAAYDEPERSTYTAGYGRALTQAVNTKHLMDFLRDFRVDYPSNPDTDFLAYAEARAFVSFLVASFGPTRFHQFLRDTRDGDLTLAAEQDFGADLGQIQSRWEVSVGLPPTVKDAGFTPPVPTPALFTPGTLPPIAATTTPFAVDVRGLLSAPSLALVGLLLALALGALVEESLRARRRGQLLRHDWTPVLPPAAIPAPLQPPMEMPAPASDWEFADAEADEARPANVVTLVAPHAPASAGRPRWYDAALAVLPAVLALAAGSLVFQVDSLHALRGAYLTVATVAAPFALALAALAFTRRSREGLPASRMMSLAIAGLLCVLPLLQATAVGRDQAQAYESRGAYALALRYYQAAGEARATETSDLQRVHAEWARAATHVTDYATATEQLRAAIGLDPSTLVADTYRLQLLDVTERWGTALAGARDFERALTIYADQLASPTCNTTCHTRLHEASGTAYLTWASAQIQDGDLTGALATLDTLAKRFGDTQAAGTAAGASSEVAAVRDYQAALAVGAQGDFSGMNARLQRLAGQYPNTAAADLAARTPEPVSGGVRDLSGMPVVGDRLYFLAFGSQSEAQGFRFDFRADTSLFKVVTTIGAGGDGVFTVRLPPGYWYVPVWDDPSQAGNNYFNAPIANTNDAFTVVPFTPAFVGVIVGF